MLKEEKQMALAMAKASVEFESVVSKRMEAIRKLADLYLRLNDAVKADRIAGDTVRQRKDEGERSKILYFAVKEISSMAHTIQTVYNTDTVAVGLYSEAIDQMEDEELLKIFIKWSKVYKESKKIELKLRKAI